MRGAWTLARYDLLRWRRMPWAIAMALLPPALLALTEVALAMNASCEPVALVVEGDGPCTRAMCEIIAADTDAYQLTISDARQAQAALGRQQVAAIITIPVDFDAQVARHAARVDLDLNNIDIDFADDIRRSLDRSVGAFDGLALAPDNDDDPSGGEDPAPSAKAAAAVEAPASDAYHIAVDERDLRQTTVGLVQYQLVPVLVLLVLQVGMLGTAMLTSLEAELGWAAPLRLSPLPRWEIILGRMMAGCLASFIVLVPVVALGMWCTVVVVPPGHGLALAALAGSTALAAAGAGAMLGALVRGVRLAALSAAVAAVYAFLLGGGFTTMVFLPGWVRAISACDPIRYAIDGVRQAMFYPDLRGCGLDVLVLSLTAAAMVALAALTQRSR